MQSFPDKWVELLLKAHPEAEGTVIMATVLICVLMSISVIPLMGFSECLVNFCEGIISSDLFSVNAWVQTHNLFSTIIDGFLAQAPDKMQVLWGISCEILDLCQLCNCSLII